MIKNMADVVFQDVIKNANKEEGEKNMEEEFVLTELESFPLYDENGCCNFCGCQRGTCESDCCSCSMCEKVNNNIDFDDDYFNNADGALKPGFDEIYEEDCYF